MALPYTFGQRLAHAWNAFQGNLPFQGGYALGPEYSYRPDRLQMNYGNERSIVASVYNRIGIDVSAIPIRHSRVDKNGSFIETIDSGLNHCLTVEANIDQTSRAFIQDVVMSLCDEGSVAIVPIDTTISPSISSGFDVLTMRTGKITAWYPQHIRAMVYDDREGMGGRQQELLLEKKNVAIIENPLYSVMNEPNSTLKRLVSKLNLLDVIDNQSGSGKLDLLISLPYIVKTDARIQQAEKRRAQIEAQLSDSKYGIAYIDGTEKVTQLNRPAENNLMGQIEFLTRMLYSQLGLADSIFDGTADEKTILNYHARTVEPILSAITDEISRKFLTKTGRSQGQAIKHYRDPFALVPAADLANISDSFTRNEILTSNEIRAVIGFKPSKEKQADELRNKNLNNPVAPSSKNTDNLKREKGNGNG